MLMIIRTLFTDLSMVDMLATITNMTTHVLLTMIISFVKFTNVLGLRLFPCLPQLPCKNHRSVSFYLYCYILPFLSLSLFLLFFLYILILPSLPLP